MEGSVSTTTENPHQVFSFLLLEIPQCHNCGELKHSHMFLPRPNNIKKIIFQPGKSWVVLTDAEDDSLAGLPLYITAGHPSAVLLAHPLGLNLWLPLYITAGHFFENADSDWLLIIKTKCRLWLFAKLNRTTSKQEKWCSSWLSPITKYNKSVIMTSTQWKKIIFFIDAWSSALLPQIFFST